MTFPLTPYPIFGYITDGLGVALSGVTVRVKNTTTNEYEDVSSDTDGSYLSDLANLPSGYSNLDGIEVTAYSSTKTTTVSTYVYPNGIRIDLKAYLNFIIGSTVVDKITSLEVIRSLGERVWMATADIENKNGRRTSSFQAYQGVQIDINGVNVFKGRLNKDDPTRQHHLILGSENYSAYLTDRIVQSESYVSTSIYNIITAAGTGLIPKYLPILTTTNVANDANTSTVITKDFEKLTVMECLQFLGETASLAGYDFYVDNSLDLHFEPRRTIDSGLSFTNVGINKNVVDWKWKDKEARDIFNKVYVYYGAGGVSSVQRNDLASQTNYGIREYPPITDTTISNVSEANALGDRTLSKYSDAYKEGILLCKTSTAMLDLRPGNLITVNLVGAGLQNSTFPWTFPITFSSAGGTQYIVMEVKHMFPAFRTEIKVSEYQKDLSNFFAKLLRKNY